MSTSTRPLAIILSPLRGVGDTPQARRWSYDDHLVYARRCLRDSLSRGEAPIASHLLYPQDLDDGDDISRAIGIACEHAWILAAANHSLVENRIDSSRKPATIAVYHDHGISPGMFEALHMIFEQRLPVKIEFRKLPTDTQKEPTL